MVKLTEDMIVARTRVSDLSHVKKLNCWGAELTDISVIRKLNNVEVLSLSVNNISTLADIQHCKNLQELYIRKNKIPEINEICWIKDLSRLKNLWLEENPFAEVSPDLYRLTVIKALPQLQKLDNIPVQSEEMAEAMRRGLDLTHPLDSPDENVAYQQEQPRQPPPVYREEPVIQSDERRASRGSYYEPEYEERERRESAVMQYVQSPSRRVSNQVFDDRGPVSHSPPQPSPSRRTSCPPEEDVRRMRIREEGAIVENSYQEHRHSYSGPPSTDNGYYRAPHSTPEGVAHYPRAQSSENFRSPYAQAGDAHAIVSQHYDSTYRQVHQQLESAHQLVAQRSHSPQRPYPPRPKNRNSNVLSAILCLIKEIDGPSLEVVEMAVRCRMEELED